METSILPDVIISVAATKFSTPWEFGVASLKQYVESIFGLCISSSLFCALLIILWGKGVPPLSI
jgi:hypothetical protein